MKKLINRILKLVGLNLVRAKRRKTTKWQTLPIGPSGVPALPPYTREEHYVGDDCLGAHRGLDIVPGDNGAYAEEMARLKQPTSDNNITGPTS